MKMFRLGAVLVCAALCLANNGSCTGGGVNSASAAIQRTCAQAAAVQGSVDLAASLAAPALVALGVPQAKVDQIVAGIRRGELAVTTGCAIVQVVASPPGGAAGPPTTSP